MPLPRARGYYTTTHLLQLIACHNNLFNVALALIFGCGVVSAPCSIRHSSSMVPESNCRMSLATLTCKAALEALTRASTSREKTRLLRRQADWINSMLLRENQTILAIFGTTNVDHQKHLWKATHIVLTSAQLTNQLIIWIASVQITLMQ